MTGGLLAQGALQADFFDLYAANRHRLGSGHFAFETGQLEKAQSAVIGQRHPDADMGAFLVNKAL